MADDDAAETAQQILGRSRELSRIDEMVERLATGRGSVVVLMGPPGIGLTALLEEVIARVGDAVADVRAVHVPSGLLEDDGSAAVAASAAAGEAFWGLAETVVQTLGDSDIAAPDDPRLVQVAVTALRTLSTERPLLVTVDNLPVADGSVFKALASLAAGIAFMPVLVVVTSHVLPRSSFEESPVGPLWVRRVPALSTAGSVALGRAAADRWVPHSVAATIAQRTGGNPGDLGAVCKVLEPDQLAGLEPLPEALPGTAVTTATYRHWWDALGTKNRLLVLGAAVAVTPDRAMLEEWADVALADVAGPDGEPVLSEQDGLVVSRDPRLLSAVRALTPPREFRAALTALATCYPQDSLDRHWLAVRGGEPLSAEVLDALLRGARELLDHGDAATVQALVGDVLHNLGRTAPPLELLLLGGVAAMYCGHTGRAVTLLAAALAEGPDGLARIFPLLLIAMTYRESSLPHHLVTSCIQRLEKAEPAAAASIAALAARLCAEYGQEKEAGRYLRQAEAVLRDSPRDADEQVGLALAHAMVEHGLPTPRALDPLAAFGVRRPGGDIAGWLLEVQALGHLVESGDWTRARGEISDLHARVRRFPAPLLSAHLALVSIRFHLSMCEHRRADEIAAVAVETMLPLHVPHGGAGIALLAQVSLIRGRHAQAEEWLADVAELSHLFHGTPVLTVAHHEALGLRARLSDDLGAAMEHYLSALRAGRVQSSTLIDLAHLRWRTGVRDDDELAAALHAHDGDPALTAAAALLRSPSQDLVDTVDSVAAGTRDVIRPAHEAQLLEFAADRIGALTTDPAAQTGSWVRDLSAQRDYRLRLLRRARDLYARSGAAGRAEVTEREIARLERSTTEDVDLSDLTADELTIAQLVHSGATNKEVASALYLSVRTVELRLTSIYRKLGIGSRRELRQLAGVAATGSTPT